MRGAGVLHVSLQFRVCDCSSLSRRAGGEGLLANYANRLHLTLALYKHDHIWHEKVQRAKLEIPDNAVHKSCDAGGSSLVPGLLSSFSVVQCIKKMQLKKGMRPGGSCLHRNIMYV